MDGEYLYDIGSAFNGVIYYFEDGNGDAYPTGVFEAWPADIYLLGAGSSVVHNPKTGAFTISGESFFDDVTPTDLNIAIPITDSFDILSTTTKITGKTYQNKSTKRPILAINGSILFGGNYDVGVASDQWVQIKKGAFQFQEKDSIQRIWFTQMVLM